MRRIFGSSKVPQVLPDGTLFYQPDAPFTNPNFGPIFTLVSDAHSWYDSVQARNGPIGTGAISASRSFPPVSPDGAQTRC
jgi:hypothetical protein